MDDDIVLIVLYSFLFVSGNLNSVWAAGMCDVYATECVCDVCVLLFVSTWRVFGVVVVVVVVVVFRGQAVSIVRLSGFD